jgi:hypothetical protein
MTDLPNFETIIPHWSKELQVSITVTDKLANIIYMNDKALATFAKYGGSNILGQSLYDCHNPDSSAIIRDLLATGGTNIYTIEKQGVKKFIYQSAWFTGTVISGLVEISIVLPNDMPHHIRG